MTIVRGTLCVAKDLFICRKSRYVAEGLFHLSYLAEISIVSQNLATSL